MAPRREIVINALFLKLLWQLQFQVPPTPVTTCLACKVYLLMAAQHYLRVAAQGCSCVPVPGVGTMRCWDSKANLEALSIPSSAAITSTYLGCAHLLLSHTPSATPPRGGNTTLEPFMVILCGYPGWYEVWDDAELASVQLGWCCTGMVKKKNLAPFQSSKKYLSLWALIQAHL